MSKALLEEKVLEEPAGEEPQLGSHIQHQGAEIQRFGSDSSVEGSVEAILRVPEIPEVDPEVARMGQAALQIGMQMRQILETGEQVVMLLVKPELLTQFEPAFRAVPENILPQEFVASVPLTADPECEGVRIIVRADLIREFLLSYYGPTQAGGNGLLQAMEEAIARIPNCPIRIDLKALEILFLLELKERVKPGLVIPTGANLRQGLPANLRQR